MLVGTRDIPKKNPAKGFEVASPDNKLNKITINYKCRHILFLLIL